MEEEEVHQEMPPAILQHANTGAPLDVDEIIAMPGVEVDDDRMPAPENIPGMNGDAGDGCVLFPWGHAGLCHPLSLEDKIFVQV